MKTTNLSHLTEQEQEAIATCVNRMYAELNGCIYAIILFGSKARGDDTADSDIDLLIVTATNDWQVDQTLRGIAAEVSLEYDVLFNTHIISHERWADMERRRATYWRNVQRDGIELRPATTPAKKPRKR
jgi:predicted nucleotidyltransferase